MQFFTLNKALFLLLIILLKMHKMALSFFSVVKVIAGIRNQISFKGGEASSWDYGQKLKKHLNTSLLNFSWLRFIVSEIFHFEVGKSPRQCCQLKPKFVGIGIYYLNFRSISVVTLTHAYVWH